MKKIIIVFALILSCKYITAQSPQLINYQAAVRNSAGVPIVNKPVTVRFEMRQGSASGSVVFTETHTLSTNALGLFSTQIGKVSAGSFTTVGWQNGPLFLNVSIDTTATGVSFTDMGTQQLVSVPFAIHSQFATHVPNSLAAGVLTIGNNSYTLSPPTVYSGSAGISVTGTVISNTAPDQTVTISNGSNVSVSGSYPNFTVASTPSLALNGSSLSISGGNVISLPAATTPSISQSGIATVNPSSGYNFTVGVQTPTYTSVGPSSITGTWPNLTLTSPVTPTVNATGLATVSTGPNYLVGVPIPVFNNTGPTTISGTWPNLTVTSPTVPPAATVTANSAGIATVSPGPNSFTIGVQTPSWTSTGASSITGTWPNLVVNSPAASTITANASGIATISTGPNYTVGVRTPTWTSTGPVVIGGTWPNLTITSPTVPPSTTVTAAPGLATVSAGPNFTVGVQTPTWTSSGPVLIGGTWPNMTVTSPVTTSVSAAATGIATVSAGPNYTVGVQAPNFTSVGVTTVSGVWPNLTVTTPPLSYTASTGVLAQGSNTALVAPTVSYSNNVLRVGPATNTVPITNSPWSETTNTVVLTNTAAIVGIGTNSPSEQLQVQNANSTQASLISGNTSTSSLSFGKTTNHFMGNIAYDNINNTMSFWTNNTADRLFINNSGNVGIRNNNPAYDLSIYNPLSTSSALQLKNVGSSANGFLITHNTTATSLLSYDNLPMTFGVNSSNMMSLNTSGHVTIGNNTPVAANTGLLISRNGSFDNRLVITGGDNTNSYGGILSFAENLNQTQGMSIKMDAIANKMYFTTDFTGSNPIVGIGGYSGTNGGMSIGSTYAFSNPSTNGLLVEGNVAIGTTVANGKFHTEVSNGRFRIFNNGPAANTILLGEFTGNGTLGPQVRYAMTGGGSFVDIGQNTGSDFVIEHNDVVKMLVQSSGRVGINNTSPTATLDIGGNVKIADGTQGANKVLTSDALGNASWQNSARNTGFAAYGTSTQTLSSGGGNLIIFNSEDYDDGNNFASNGYTAPTAGVYHFDASVRMNGFGSAGQYVYIYLAVNGSLEKTNTVVSNTSAFSASIGADIKLNANDVVTVYIFTFTNTETTAANQLVQWFTGHRVY